jgi:putative flippase GtrA
MKGIREKIIVLQVLHYIFAGGVTFTVEYCIFLALFYMFSASGFVANTISFVIALGVSFSLNKLWVFRAAGNGKAWQKQTFFYVGLSLFNLTTTNAILHYLLLFSVPAFVAKLLVIGLVACWNFIIFRKFIFKKMIPTGVSTISK